MRMKPQQCLYAIYYYTHLIHILLSFSRSISQIFIFSKLHTAAPHHWLCRMAFFLYFVFVVIFSVFFAVLQWALILVFRKSNATWTLFYSCGLLIIDFDFFPSYPSIVFRLNVVNMYLYSSCIPKIRMLFW